MKKNSLIAREGYPYIFGSFAVALVAAQFGVLWFAGLALFAAIFSAFFFRNPKRNIPQDSGAIVSPADGKIVAIRRFEKTPLTGKPSMVVSIFMSVFNGHMNRAPVAGKVQKLAYHQGKFLVASKDEALAENERNEIWLRDEAGRDVVVSQVAGLVARRIVCYLQEGMSQARGERFGLIQFGSRVDVYLPLETKLSVQLGQKVKSGSSILGFFS